ncbi:hypothetical protein I3J27_15210 [Bradyrhizobium xenonodulans]|uniref:DUF4190 domain-containing protein n=1 Tax=Bradyrhizobium xenonodulans TaxID=2736875 RepID=A0ABY7MVX4_9BRAD|nr:hypothetical protein [Bradyrhizobium xenonodulans]WBL81699.1 hypothetical protein I3J27_15210 [Bradyrhizobium xenonodulans]
MKNSSRIAAGVAGAVAGYVAIFVLFSLLDFGNRADPITSGLLGLFVYSPIGAIAGAVLASWLVTRSGQEANNGGLARNSLKSLGVVALLCVTGLGIYIAYAYATATPWLNRNGANPLLVFEVRFPPGATVPAQGISIELQTDLNTMPGEMTPAGFHRDGDQYVIAGEVELAFRTSHRQLGVNIQGQPGRLYPIDLSARAPHAPEFGTWRRLADGSEIRYRAKWPGKS